MAVTATVVEDMGQSQYFPQMGGQERPSPCAMRPSRYPLLQQRHLDEVQETAMDEMGQEQQELAVTNEILQKMRDQILSREGLKTTADL